MRTLFPLYVTRTSVCLAFTSMAMVWSGIIATLFVDKEDTIAPYLLVWLVVGIVACFAALGSLANDRRKAKP